MKNTPGLGRAKSSGILFPLAPALLLLVIAAYSNHFPNDFHFDDAHTIVNNAYIRDIGNIPLFFTDATTSSSLPQNQSYRPVVYTTLALDYRLGGGLKPPYFHLSTFILFLVQGILMYFLFLRIFEAARPEAGSEFSGAHTAACFGSAPGEGISNAADRSANKLDGSALLSLLAVALYLLHPANAETINYVIARSDSLSTLFIIAALVAFIYSGVCRKWGLYLVFATLAILAKPVAAIFPVLLVLCLPYIENEERSGAACAGGRSGPNLVFVSIQAFFWCLLVLLFVRKMTPASWVPGGSAFFNYAITQPYVVLRYFVTFFAPFGLSADTDWKPLESLADPRLIGGCMFIAILLLTAFATIRNRRLRPIAFGILWFLAALIPTSIMPLAEVTNDHRMFFPFVGPAISVTWALNLAFNALKRRTKKKELLILCFSLFAFALLAACAWGTHTRNQVWRSEETLWRDVTIKSPQNGRGLMNYGLALMAKADYAGAEDYFLRSLSILPRYGYLHINLGVLKEAQGKSAEAEQYFRNALLFDPFNPECYYYYAQFLKNRNRLPEALPLLYKALELAPAHLEARHLLVQIHWMRSEFGQMSKIAGETLRIAPDDRQAELYLRAAKNGAAPPAETVGGTPEEYLDLSLRYYQAGLYEKSIEAAGQALKLKPNYDPAYNNICSAYNMLGMWDRAIEAGERAVELNPGNRLAQNNLEWARMRKQVNGIPESDRQ